MPRKKVNVLPVPNLLAGKREENKRQRFERIGRARMNKALTTIRLLGNLASANYDWDERDVRAIADTIQFAVNDTLSKFHRQQKSAHIRFNFPSNGKAKLEAV